MPPPRRGSRKRKLVEKEFPVVDEEVDVDTNETDVKNEKTNSDNEEEFIEVELDDAPSTSFVNPSEVEEVPLNVETTEDVVLEVADVHVVKRGRPMGKKNKKTPAVIPFLSEESRTPRPPVMPARTHRTRQATLNSRLAENPRVDDRNDPDDAEELKCELCCVPLLSPLELVEHLRANHKEHVNKDDIATGSLLCSHAHCSASFPDVAHLIAHLVAYHNQLQYRIRKINFNRIDKFEAWHKEVEKSARCSFMSSNNPVGSEESYDIEMYCEYCDQWRTQNEKGPPHPQQVPQKIIGCPAHFKAYIDNKRDRVSVIGCFAHLGHHKKASWSTIPCEQFSNVKEELTEYVAVKCKSCEATFRTQGAALRHHRRAHDGQILRTAEPKQPSLECGDPECDVVCDSMLTLVDHVQTFHNRPDLTVEEYKFNSSEDFEAWKLRMEIDTCSKFAKISGRDMTKECTKYFLCHLSGHTNRLRKKGPTTDRLRNRPTKKLGRYCTAFMSLKLNKEDKTVSIRCCLGHFGHGFDVRRLPLTDALKKEIAELLMSKCAEEDVVQIVRNRYSEHERGYWLQRYEVRNVALKLQKEGQIIKEVYAPIEDERDWDEPISTSHNYQMHNHQAQEYDMQPMSMMQYDNDSKQMASSSNEYSSRNQRTLTDIHISKRKPLYYPPPEPTRPPRLIATRPVKNSKRQILPQMELVEYVEADDYNGDGEIVEMREVDGMIDTDGAMYFDAPFEDEEKVVTLPHDVSTIHNIPAETAHIHHLPPRKRIPLLKEPTTTGNADFDNLMTRIKIRIDNISHQLKETQDVSKAQELLREIKTLEGRLVSGGVGQTTVPPILHGPDSRWDEVGDEFYEDSSEAYMQQVQEARDAQQVQVDDDADNSQYQEYMEEDLSAGVVEVEAEEIVE